MGSGWALRIKIKAQRFASEESNLAEAEGTAGLLHKGGIGIDIDTDIGVDIDIDRGMYIYIYLFRVGVDIDVDIHRSKFMAVSANLKPAGWK